MANLYSCPVCGNTGLKQNGAQFICMFCKNTFSEATLNATQSESSPNTTQTGSSGGQSPALAYVNAMFGSAPTPPPSNGGFMAPPDSLVQDIQRNAELLKQREAEALAAASRSGRSGSSSNGGGNKRNSSSGSASSSSNSSSSSNNSASSSGNDSDGNSRSSSNGSSGSTPSDSENNVKFLDNVSLMNDLAYELVNGNANAWANIARDRGIINSKQHTEIKYIVATRNCIAHGSGDTVRITAELVKSARDYYELMRRTASQVR